MSRSDLIAEARDYANRRTGSRHHRSRVMSALYLLVADADHVIEALPEVGLSGARMQDDPKGQVVKVCIPEGEDAEDVWFELSWHADRLGIINGQVADETGAES